MSIVSHDLAASNGEATTLVDCLRAKIHGSIAMEVISLEFLASILLLNVVRSARYKHEFHYCVSDVLW